MPRREGWVAERPPVRRRGCCHVLVGGGGPSSLTHLVPAFLTSSHRLRRNPLGLVPCL